MVVLAVVLIALAAVVTVGVVLAGPTSTTLGFFDSTINTNTASVFFAGLAIGVVFLLALGLMRIGLRRGRQRRDEVRALRERHTKSVRELEQEKERLAREKAELTERLGHEPETSAGRRTAPAAGRSAGRTDPVRADSDKVGATRADTPKGAATPADTEPAATKAAEPKTADPKAAEPKTADPKTADTVPAQSTRTRPTAQK
jgi:hypothetical protein